MSLRSYHVWVCGYICLIIFDLWVIVFLIFIVTTEINTSVQARTHTKQN
jgi:hypothetical protein